MEILSRLPEEIKIKVRHYVLGFQYLEKNKDTKIKGYKNSKGEKTGLWFIYHHNELWYERNYKNGIKHGVQKVYYGNGNLVYELNYKNGKQHGNQKRIIYENGKKIE